MDRLTHVGSISNGLMDAQASLEHVEKERKKTEVFTLEDVQKMLN